jgi:hypothetical protein
MRYHGLCLDTDLRPADARDSCISISINISQSTQIEIRWYEPSSKGQVFSILLRFTIFHGQMVIQLFTESETSFVDVAFLNQAFFVVWQSLG